MTFNAAFKTNKKPQSKKSAKPYLKNVFIDTHYGVEPQLMQVVTTLLKSKDYLQFLQAKALCV